VSRVDAVTLLVALVWLVIVAVAAVAGRRRGKTAGELLAEHDREEVAREVCDVVDLDEHRWRGTT
jgi:hypothetical protein